MPNCACLMMHKNDLLLEAWILYHGYLFGMDNLYVYDNGSNDPGAREVLYRYENLGVNVIWSHTKIDDFYWKGEIFRNLINKLQSERPYDFYFALDSDEFVTLCGEKGFSSSRKEINDYLNYRKGSKQVLRVNYQLINIPGRLDTFALTGIHKCILPNVHVTGMDHGFHTAQLENEEEYSSTRIIYAHLHNKPFDIVLQSAKLKLQPFVDTDDIDALKQFTGVGNHLLRYLLGNVETYHKSYENTVRVNYAGLKFFFQSFKLDGITRVWSVDERPEWNEYKNPNKNIFEDYARSSSIDLQGKFVQNSPDPLIDLVLQESIYGV